MSNLGIRNEDDLLEQLLRKMSVNDSDGNQVREAQPVQTVRGDINVVDILQGFNNFNDFLINSPFVVQENPQFVVLNVNGINFNSASVPRDKNKLGWKVLSALCARSFFKQIKGRTLYDRLRKNYYVNGRKTLLKLDGKYFIYDDSARLLTLAQMPVGYRDYISPMSIEYSVFNNVNDLGTLKNILIGYENLLLLGMENTPDLRTKLRAIIEDFPAFKNIQPIIPNVPPNIPRILGVRTTREYSPDPEDSVMGEYRQDRQIYVIPSKRTRNRFGKKTKKRLPNLGLKQIDKLIKEVMKY
jgi:hypothetical protein